MSIDIRKNIIKNFKDASTNDIINSIAESLVQKEEITLPGLGVFFEILWNNSDESFKKIMVENIQKGL
ncbi:MAG: small acid-soluble spore protein SspI [Bacilli bacterium]